ncbi:MAG: tripartite tricarboxylate transporter substrate binding protein [Betaproteobacteria bacterium]|nr:tripartite tricarboxylate transporter substrate binding protein [Betaproteobacteria bacterium]
MDVWARGWRGVSAVDTQTITGRPMHKRFAILFALAAALIVQPAIAATWPTKPIRLIVPFPPGGGTDLAGRAAANRLSEALAQPVIVDNRGGAGGVIGSDIVARANADGYTLGIATSSTHPVAGLTQKIPYDALKSFAPVTQIGVTPYIIVAAPALPANTLAELIAYAKANPGKMNVAHVGTGTLGYLITEAFKLATGTDIVPVAFKGSSAIYPDLTSNRVQIFFDNPVASVPQVKAGRLKAIALTQRTPLLPNTPTLEDAGLKGFNHGFWYGIVAPAGTPRAVVERVAREMAAYAKSTAGKNELAGLAIEPTGLTPAEFTATIQSDIERWGKVARAIGLKPQ